MPYSMPISRMVEDAVDVPTMGGGVDGGNVPTMGMTGDAVGVRGEA
jgi:hypothetical protein